MRLKALAVATALAFAGTSPASDNQLQTQALPTGSEALQSPWNTHLVKINALNAWSSYPTGTYGRGVTVAIIDSGINYSHTEFAGRILSGYNAINNTTGAQIAVDGSGHGTHVAGIVGAAANGRGMAGVANEAFLLPVQVFGSGGSATTTVLDAGIRWAAPRAAILNMSLGGSSPMPQATIQSALSARPNGTLILAAAGNTGGANPEWPARFAKETWANGQIIAVGSVNASNQISSFSNRAGDTMYFYVVAPGESIASTYTGGSNAYVMMSGTSMATPAVSGAAATIWGYWPYLNAKQVANILLKTATDLGAPGVDPIYGRGLINLQKALQPSNPTVYSASGTTTTLSGSAITTSRVTASAIKSASFNAVDEFGRTFSYRLEGFARTPQTSTVNTLFEGMDKTLGLIERQQKGHRLQLQAYRSPTSANAPIGSPLAEETSTQINGFNYVRGFDCSANACAREFSLGANGFADKYFGLASRAALPMTAMDNPYFALAGDRLGHAGLGFDLGDGYKAKIGFLAGNPLQGQRSAGLARNSGGGWIAELAHSGNRSNVFLSAGSVTENRGTSLGFSGIGGMRLDNAGTSHYVKVDGTYQLTAKTLLLGSLAIGETARVAGSGAVEGLSGARTQSWTLGLARSDAWNRGDKLAFAVSQPLHATQGNLTLVSPEFDMDGNLHLNRQTFGLKPETTETRYELGYSAPAGKQGKMQFNAMHRVGVDGIAGQNDTAVGVRYLTSF